MSAVSLFPRPEQIIWEVTYACPLRCKHCYTESGRRPSRQLPRSGFIHLARRIAELRPQRISISGGEPLLVPDLLEAISMLVGDGITVELSTGGWTADDDALIRVAEVVHDIHLSLDGSTSDLNDWIRGRIGAYERAIHALRILDQVRSTRTGTRLVLAIDVTLTRSTFGQITDYVTRLLPTLPSVDYVVFNAACPFGTAIRSAFAEEELLSEEQLAELRNPNFVRAVQDVAPRGTIVIATDNWELCMRPTDVLAGRVRRCMFVEPDGAVRATPGYRGVVGNLLHEEGLDLWARTVAHWSHPVLISALSNVESMLDWIAAARLIDQHFMDESPSLIPISRQPLLKPGGDVI